MAVQFHGESLARELGAWDVGQHAPSIDIDGVAARRLDDGNAVVGDMPSEVGRGCNAVLQILGLKNLFQAYGDGFEVASGKSSVSRKTFGENEHIGFLLGQLGIVGAQESADVREGIFLSRKGAAIGERKHFLSNFARQKAAVTGLVAL